MMRRRASNLAAFCLLVLAAVPASSDVVTLTDGSRVIGTVVELYEGKIILETQFAGTLEIDATLVESLEVDRPVNVGMTTGDRLVGPIERKPGLDEPVVETELGSIPIAVDKVRAIWPPDGKSPEARVMEAQLAAVREEMEAQRAKWALSIEAGVFYEEGNSDTMNARGRIELKRTSPKDLLRFYVSGDYAEENDVRSAAEAKIGAYYEHKIDSRWFAYAANDYEYDEFENLDLRAIFRGGVGYYWIKKDDHELKTRVGAGYQHESFMDGSTTDQMLMDVGLDYRVDINKWLRFTNATTWYPTFDGIDDYRLISDSALIIPLHEERVWNLKLGALYEYDSIPDQGRERLDQTYYANVLVNIE